MTVIEHQTSAHYSVCTGLSFPMYPMRPTEGRMLRSRAQVRQLVREVAQFNWIMQPKLVGDRACLAVINRRTYVQTRHGGWYKHTVANRHDFLSLEDGTAFDGVVYDRQFHPFEALAVDGTSLLEDTTETRVEKAKTLVSLLGHEWMFEAPTEDWLMGLSAHSPKWAGVVLKRSDAPYVIQADARSASLTWMKKRWI